MTNVWFVDALPKNEDEKGHLERFLSRQSVVLQDVITQEVRSI